MAYRITKDSSDEYIVAEVEEDAYGDVVRIEPFALRLASDSLDGLRTMIEEIFDDTNKHEVYKKDRYTYDEEDEYLSVDYEDMIPVDELFK
jgi:hypothetical protein